MDTSRWNIIINFRIKGIKSEKWREIYCSTAYTYITVKGRQVYMCVHSFGISCIHEKVISIRVESNKPSSCRKENHLYGQKILCYLVSLSTYHTPSPYVNDQVHTSKIMIQGKNCSWELKKSDYIFGKSSGSCSSKVESI